MPAATALAVAAAAGAKELFSYNRESYFFDKTLEQRRQYQGQDMRVKQFMLYRDDVRELVGLTVGKMEKYLIVNTLQLGFAVTLWTEGRPTPGGSPEWLITLFSLCTMGAFLYYLLSVWLAMHASVAAHSFGVRLLTQFVRLPVPNSEQIDRARFTASEYETMQLSDMLRVPLWKRQMQRLNAAMNSQTEDDVEEDTFAEETSTPVAMLQHVRLYRQLQANWQSYDAYSRACMALGTNQVLHALSYFILGLIISESNVPWPAFCCVLIFTTTAWVLSRMDLYLSPRILASAAALLVAPPLLTTLILALHKQTAVPALQNWYEGLSPLVYFLHVVWIIFTIGVARAEDFNQVYLPVKFRSVLYLDVFGWLSQAAEDGGAQARSGEPSGPAVNHSRSLVRTMLSVVSEESQGSRPPSGSVVAASMLSSGVLNVLLSDCQKLRSELLRDILRWEDPEVQNLLAEEQCILDDIFQVREQYEAVVKEFSKMPIVVAMEDEFALRAASGHDEAGETTVDALTSGAVPGSLGLPNRRPRSMSARSAISSSEEPAVWLQLEWNMYGGHPIEYFYSCDTRETTWEKPVGNVRCLEPKMLSKQLDSLVEGVRSLAAAVGSPTANGEEPSAGVAMGPSGSTPGNRASIGSLATLGPSGLSSGPMGQSEPGASFESQGQQRPPEERFGGAEAVDENNVGLSGFFTASPVAGLTFHPMRTSRSGRPRPHKPPGKVPWHAFLYGSLVLVASWTVGTLWYIAHFIFGVRFEWESPLEPEALRAKRGYFAPQEPRFMSEDGLERLDIAAWPHPFVRPVGLACHASFSNDTLFLADKYEVHSVRIDDANAATQPALAGCLLRAQKFLGRGIRDISMHCPSGASSCEALLLGEDGHGMLRCPLNASGGAQALLSEVRLLGGPWRAASVSHVRSSDGRRTAPSLWALPGNSTESTVLVQMRWRSDSAREEAAPVLDWPDEAVQNVTRLHVIGMHMVLGLEGTAGARTALYGWSLAGGRAQRWHMPSVGDATGWSAMCALHDKLYFAGVATDGQVGIWRTQLPGDEL